MVRAVVAGESMTVGKVLPAVAADSRIQDKVNMLFAGTVITNGRGTAIVTATGGHTEMGASRAHSACARG